MSVHQLQRSSLPLPMHPLLLLPNYLLHRQLTAALSSRALTYRLTLNPGSDCFGDLKNCVT